MLRWGFFEFFEGFCEAGDGFLAGLSEFFGDLELVLETTNPEGVSEAKSGDQGTEIELMWITGEIAGEGIENGKLGEKCEGAWQGK